VDDVVPLLPPVPVHANKMGELFWHESQYAAKRGWLKVVYP
jgi:hypothetical protein